MKDDVKFAKMIKGMNVRMFHDQYKSKLIVNIFYCFH